MQGQKQTSGEILCGGWMRNRGGQNATGDRILRDTGLVDSMRTQSNQNCYFILLTDESSAPRGKRSNRTVLEVAWSMLCRSRLTLSFWSWAIDYVVYITTRRYNVTKNWFPYERLFSKSVVIDHLRVFGAKGLVIFPIQWNAQTNLRCAAFQPCFGVF